MIRQTPTNRIRSMAAARGVSSQGGTVDPIGMARLYDGSSGTGSVTGIYVPNYSGTVRVKVCAGGAHGDQDNAGDGGAGGEYQEGTFNTVAGTTQFAYNVAHAGQGQQSILTISSIDQIICNNGNGLDRVTNGTNLGGTPVSRIAGDGEAQNGTDHGGGAGSAGYAAGNGVGGRPGDDPTNPGLGGKLGLTGNMSDGGSGQITGGRAAESGVAPGGGGGGSAGGSPGRGAPGRITFTRLS